MKPLEPPAPMLAYPYDQFHIEWPCIVQPKIEGVRCLVSPDGRCFSRSGREFMGLTGFFGQHGLWVDGEIWSKDIPFQTLVGLINRTDWPGAPGVVLCVFDLINTQEQVDRLLYINSYLDHPNIQRVAWQIVPGRKTADRVYLESKSAEGIMYRRMYGKYQPGRSRNLHKRKRLYTEDYRCIGAVRGQGKYHGMLGALVLELPDGGSFHVGGGFSVEQRIQFWEQRPLGKLITVEFRMKSTYGKPLCPQFICIRNYE